MKTNRQYFNVETVAGNFEQDLISQSLPNFKTYIRRTLSYASFLPEYVGNLDALAKKVYGTEKLWWVIALINDITDPYTEDLVGTLLKLPNILDINDFYVDNYLSYKAYQG